MYNQINFTTKDAKKQPFLFNLAFCDKSYKIERFMSRIKQIKLFKWQLIQINGGKL